MTVVRPTSLNEFVAFVDDECGGNLRHPRVVQRYQPFELAYDTRVDPSFDPFGPDYFAAQLELYREISGRPLDQWSGELHPVDIDSLIDAPNPQGILDVPHVSENVRALSSLLSMACLPSRARVLDMGAGHGMSSEVFAFSGARVLAVDIDPNLSTLAELRAKRRALDIRRAIMNFDSLAGIEPRSADAAFFFQSLHHALKPWQLLEDLAEKLTPDGVIGFCGEPVHDAVWKYWACAWTSSRSMWLASSAGSSRAGPRRSFSVASTGWAGIFLLFRGGHQGGLTGLAARSPAGSARSLPAPPSLGSIRWALSCRFRMRGGFSSQIGELSWQGSIGRFMRAQDGHAGGFLCFGPYAALSGDAIASSFFCACCRRQRFQAMPHSRVIFDVVSGAGSHTHLVEQVAVLALATERSRLASRSSFRVQIPSSSKPGRSCRTAAQSGKCPCRSSFRLMNRASGMGTDSEWECWGQRDPYFGVLAHPKFRRDQLDGRRPREFLATGRAHADYVLGTCRRQIDREFAPARILDFGCGVGRVLIPFAAVATEAVGLDISPAMLAEAARNCTEAGVTNVRLLPSDDELSALGGSFDLVHSCIVLQHIEPTRGRAIFKRLVERVVPGGIAALQVTFAWDIHAETFGRPPPEPPPKPPGPLQRVLGPIRGAMRQPLPVPAASEVPPSDPEMQMHFYDLNDLLFIARQGAPSASMPSSPTTAEYSARISSSEPPHKGTVPHHRLSREALGQGHGVSPASDHPS